jgi:putative heme-binding domain-containing protein
VAFGYEAWVIQTRDQRTYTGFLASDGGDSVVIRDLGGEQRLIPAREIVLRERQRSSIMPDNIALGMTPQELVDVVEFLAAARGGAP